MRKRTARIDGERGEHGKDGVAKIGVGDAAFGCRQGFVIEDPDARPAERRQQIFPKRAVGFGFDTHHGCGNRVQKILPGAAVHAFRGHSGGELLLEHRHADHEKLVQVGAQDGEEIEAIEKRIGGVLGFVEHALLKGQQAQLAVEEQRGRVEVGNRFGLDPGSLRFEGGWSHGGTQLSACGTKRNSYAFSNCSA